MEAPVYIGDEVSASGYRLAGMEIHTPEKDKLFAEIQSLCEHAPLVLLSAEFADCLTEDRLQLLLTRTDTPVVVVPDVRGRYPLADLETKLRKQLGVLE